MTPNNPPASSGVAAAADPDGGATAAAAALENAFAGTGCTRAKLAISRRRRRLARLEEQVAALEKLHVQLEARNTQLRRELALKASAAETAVLLERLGIVRAAAEGGGDDDLSNKGPGDGASGSGACTSPPAQPQNQAAAGRPRRHRRTPQRVRDSNADLSAAAAATAAAAAAAITAAAGRAGPFARPQVKWEEEEGEKDAGKPEEEEPPLLRADDEDVACCPLVAATTAAAAAAAAPSARLPRAVTSPERMQLLRGSVLGLFARREGEGDDDIGTHGNDDDDDLQARLMASVAANLDARVAQRRDAVLAIDVAGYLRVAQDFRARAALELWHASRRGGDGNGDGDGGGGGGGGGGGARPLAATTPTTPTPTSGPDGVDLDADAALAPLVKDAIVWVTAAARHKPELLRELAALDHDTGEPLAPDDGPQGAVEAQDAWLLGVAKTARYSELQLVILSDLYEQDVALLARADADLRSAARDLAAALGDGDGDGSGSISSISSSSLLNTSAAAAAAAAAVERALSARQTAVHAAAASTFQVLSPTQYALLCVACLPRPFTCALALRGAWLLFRGGQQREQLAGTPDRPSRRL